MKLSKKALMPKGFKAGGVSCGIKRSGKEDLALIFSQFPARAACAFTSNTFKAAPVKVSKRHLDVSDTFRAILANSGNANCFTGAQGLNAAINTCKELGKALGVEPREILVASTGIIGRKLPTEKIISAYPRLIKGLFAQGMNKAARAILTTDNCIKVAGAEVNISGKKVTLCGIAKGAGMIAPKMLLHKKELCATMLCFIVTDADISDAALKSSLRQAVDSSFNNITIDNCMSTNDMVAVLANSAAGNKPIRGGRDFLLFCKALEAVSLELAKMIVRDAEGATKFITITVKGAKSEVEARTAAMAIANSDLFKTAVYGENPNFGRIVAAIGSQAGVKADESKLKIKCSSLKKRDVFLEVGLSCGRASSSVYTCDLSPEYVNINAGYN